MYEEINLELLKQVAQGEYWFVNKALQDNIRLIVIEYESIKQRFWWSKQDLERLVKVCEDNDIYQNKLNDTIDSLNSQVNNLINKHDEFEKNMMSLEETHYNDTEEIKHNQTTISKFNEYIDEMARQGKQIELLNSRLKESIEANKILEKKNEERNIILCNIKQKLLEFVESDLELICELKI